MSNATTQGYAITDKADIDLYKLITIERAVFLESMGMKGRGPSAAKLAKLNYGCKGNRAAILLQLQELVKMAKEMRQARQEMRAGL
jgi:hypothetical protein